MFSGIAPRFQNVASALLSPTGFGSPGRVREGEPPPREIAGGLIRDILNHLSAKGLVGFANKQVHDEKRFETAGMHCFASLYFDAQTWTSLSLSSSDMCRVAPNHVYRTTADLHSVRHPETGVYDTVLPVYANKPPSETRRRRARLNYLPRLLRSPSRRSRCASADAQCGPNVMGPNDPEGC